ncbi:MAG: class I SAM-dependent methyltransferase [Deltaproteobacteria bacterium]|nr:class I SAM-dependent methyltransferase [Deltaproteobacteria bacterium]
MMDAAKSITRGFREPKKAAVYVWLLWKYKFQGMPYREFFREMMKLRTAKDPRKAIGGMWEKIGALQFEFLVKQGLRPEHELLDLGCGSLRGGLHFIKYLDRGNYWGIDISEDILKAGRKTLDAEGLDWKRPILRVTDNLAFKEICGKRFDYLMAHSVFTHMPCRDVSEILSNAPRVMRDNAVFYATYLEGKDRCHTKENLNFYHTFECIRGAAKCAGLTVKHTHYDHPRGQRMLAMYLTPPE